MAPFADRFVAGLPPGLLPVFYLLGVLTLLFSMVVASRLGGGIAFGAASAATLKGAGLLAVVTALNLLNWGILLAGPVWFFGLMFLFDLDYRQTRLLTKINWGMNAVWKLLLLVLLG
jgi:hypothetical protein